MNHFGDWFALFLVVGGFFGTGIIAWWAGSGAWPWERLYPDDKDVSIVDCWKQANKPKK